MNYKNEVINKINQFKPNEIIEARKLYKEELTYVPEATYFKILERMIKENKLTRISKGIYCLPKATRFGIIAESEKEIINYYTGKHNEYGMVIGYMLYNKYGLTTQIPKIIKLYSNKVVENTKIVKNVEIQQLNIQLDESRAATIEALEILQHYKEIEDINAASFSRYLKMFVSNYNNKAAKEVLKNVKYKKRTIAFLQMILKYFGVENTLSEYLTDISTYKIPLMEAIYEIAL